MQSNNDDGYDGGCVSVLIIIHVSSVAAIIVVTRGERYYRSDIVSCILALFGKYRISVISRQYRDILYDILRG